MKNSSEVKQLWLVPMQDLPPGKTKQILSRKIILAIATMFGILILLFGFTTQLGAFADSRNKSDRDTTSESREWIQDIEAYKQKGSLVGSTQRAPAKIQFQEPEQPKPASQEQRSVPYKKPSHDANVVFAKAVVSQPEAPSDPWSQVYGSAQAVKAPNQNSSSPSMGYSESDSGSGKAAEGTTSGSRIWVRLKGDAASNPSGPVIAVTTKPTRLGTIDIPKGAEIHGETSGSAPGARLMMQFRFINIQGQPSVSISGRALASDGRVGVPGTNIMGGGSDIGAAAAGSTIGAAGNVLSGLVSGPSRLLGAAIDGASRPAADKAGRLNHSEEAVVVDSGARFQIYIDEVNSR
ncbi:MAG: hypothetical protein WCK49_05210 [Myxococcaceae bacterium]